MVLSVGKLQANNCFCLHQGLCFYFLTVDFRLSFKCLSSAFCIFFFSVIPLRIIRFCFFLECYYGYSKVLFLLTFIKSRERHLILSFCKKFNIKDTGPSGSNSVSCKHQIQPRCSRCLWWVSKPGAQGASRGPRQKLHITTPHSFKEF